MGGRMVTTLVSHCRAYFVRKETPHKKKKNPFGKHSLSYNNKEKSPKLWAFLAVLFQHFVKCVFNE